MFDMNGKSEIHKCINETIKYINISCKKVLKHTQIYTHEHTLKYITRTSCFPDYTQMDTHENT